MPTRSPTSGWQYMSRHYKITLLIALYLAQGLPYGFFTLALPVLLREAGFSLKAISVLSLLAVPWWLKFLWAPYLDHRGTRRGWLLGLQCSALATALVLTQLDPQSGYTPLLLAAFLFNFIAASQDVVTDGLAVRMLDARERGLANAVQVGAYRLGMILGGGLLLWLFARTNWTSMFTGMAALLALTIVPVWWLKEPAREPSASPPMTELAYGWLKRLLQPGMLGFAGLLFCYRYGDQMVTTLLGPFLADYGLTKEVIALMKGTVGSVTSLAGALLGGWLAYSAGRRTAILASGLLQAVSFTLYIAAALEWGDLRLLWTATILEGVVGTMATVALFTLMMDACDPDHAGTDYTLFASVVVLVGFIGNFSGAAIADELGYAVAFTAGTALALLGCLAVVWVLDHKPTTPRLSRAWGCAAHAPPSATRLGAA